MWKKIFRKTPPHAIVVLRWKYKIHRLKHKIIEYLRNTPEFEESEKQEIINYLVKNPISGFPYDFPKKYKANDVVVYTDTDNGLRYVIHENKRLYFKRNWDVKKIQIYHNGLIIEQDIDSPHRYETLDFCVNEGDVVADVGAAEGNFALSVVEKVEKMYLFEVDEEWIEALNATFAPWKEKVEIISKYVSEKEEGNCISLDTFFSGKKINLIKADVEGAEIALLRGSHNIMLNTEKLKMIICTYHKQDDAENIDRLLTDYKFKTEFSKGYIIFFWGEEPLAPPYLRRGLIRAIK